MKNIYLLLISILPFIGYSQSHDSTSSKFDLPKKNSVFGEIFGTPNTYISINYERALLSAMNNKLSMTARTGFGYSYFRNYNSHLYSVPIEVNGLFGGEYIKLDLGVGYVKQYRTEILEGLGPSGIFNYEKGSFYHYSFRIGLRFSAHINESNKLFVRISTGRNFTPKRLLRNYSGKESSSSKLILSELFGLTYGISF